MNKINKEKSNKLLRVADRALQSSKILDKEKNSIKDSYNGSVAAFCVSIATSGLRPTLTIYYHKEDRREVLKIITDMLLDDEISFGFKDIKDADDNPICVNNDKPKNLLKYAFYCDDDEMKRLQREITDCGIALKQVIRTYKLTKNENA
ncbi:MAG: hypothetical protein GX372_06745 [Ignavibacteria bacterium]|nr:hypothetical protein [Ignavibacteria bacterium]